MCDYASGKFLMKDMDNKLAEAFQLKMQKDYEELQIKAKHLAETTVLSYEEAFNKVFSEYLREGN